jgi:predicted regulator of Ras-like GTPase activity (Roadblock/LC7/MglB family)
MSTFRESIQKLVDRLEGGVGGVLMGFDGIAVDSYVRQAGARAADGKPVPEAQTIGMELAHLIAQVRRAAEALEIGALHELTLRTERLTVLVHVINKDYFVVCAVLPTGNMGKARYLLRLTAPKLEAELQ